MAGAAVGAAAVISSAVVYALLLKRRRHGRVCLQRGAWSVRWAVAADVPIILRFVRELAEYEKLLHEVVMTEAQLLADFESGHWEALLCEPVAGTWLRPLSVTFVISKLWEWGDTFFLVTLGSRPPEFLHKYHHATTFWLFCLVINLPGPEKFGLLLNGGVHTLMYAHYWRPFPKPLVPLITALQIAQLTTVTYAWYASPRVCPAASFADAPRAHRLEVLTPYVMVPVYLFFFVVFFVKRFLIPQKKCASAKRD